MKFCFLNLILAGAVAGQILNDPAKCVKYTPGDKSAGTWSNVVGVDREACLKQEGAQWILGWGQTQYPDHLPLPASWWAKRMSDTGGADSDHHDRLYFSGRPAVRDMKLLYQAGWDAVLSLEDAVEGEKLGLNPLPNTADAKAVAAEAGLLFHSLPAGVDFRSQQGVDEITNFLEFALANTGSNVNGPLLVFDKNGFKAAAALQLFRARKGLIPKVNSKSVTERATLEGNFHGIDFPKETIKAIAREAKETVELPFTAMRKLPASVTDALDNYHWLKYLYNIGDVGVFDAGQIQAYHVAALKAANIKVIINMRQGTKDESGNLIASTQEPVNLLNLAFNPATKGISNAQDFLAANKALVIDPNRPASWICSHETADPDNYTPCKESTDANFEFKNPLEWGDIGQNVFTEGEDLKKAGIVYYHLPVGAMQKPSPKPFNPATFAEYAPQFIEAVNLAQKLGGHLLFHCTIGYRTGAFPTGLLAIIKKLPVHDANMMMHSWGYDVADEQTGHVFEKGSNVLFKGLDTLAFEGTTNWETGRIDGQIKLLSSAATPEQPAASPAPASEKKSGNSKDDGKDDDDDDHNSTLTAVLVFAILTFAVASAALYLVYTRKPGNGPYAQTPFSQGAGDEESEMSGLKDAV